MTPALSPGSTGRWRLSAFSPSYVGWSLLWLRRSFLSFGASQVVLVVRNLPANAGDPGSIHGWGRSPGGNGNLLHYSCLENPMDRGDLQATVRRVAKSWTWLSDYTTTCTLPPNTWWQGFPGDSVVKNLPAKQESWVRSLGLEDPLEKEMATRSSILAWEIPRTEEPGRLHSMGSQRVRHDLQTEHTRVCGAHLMENWI